MAGRPSASPCGLTPLFAAAEGFVPGMAGAVGGHAAGWVTPGADNHDAIAGLVSAVASAHPEAGRGYAPLRAWMALTWQPVVLAVLAVHRLGLVPPLDRLSQGRRGTTMMGYRLPADAPVRGDERAMVEVAGDRVRGLADGLLADLRAVAPVKPRLAHRLLADRLLAVVLRASVGEVADLAAGRAAGWMAAMRLDGHSGLVPVTLDDGRPWLALDRKACCLEYMVDGGGLCASCPRQDNATRLARMAAEWSHLCST